MANIINVIRTFVVNVNDKFDSIVKPIWDKLVLYLSKEYYLVYALVTVVLIVLLIPGLVNVIRKAGKFFLVLLIIVAIIFAIWYFFVFK